MTINTHVIRMDKRISDIWPRTALQNEMEKWHRAWDRYCLSVGEHQGYGGQVNRWHVIAFKTIYRETVQRIQSKMNMIDAFTARMQAAGRAK